MKCNNDIIIDNKIIVLKIHINRIRLHKKNI